MKTSSDILVSDTTKMNREILWLSSAALRILRTRFFGICLAKVLLTQECLVGDKEESGFFLDTTESCLIKGEFNKANFEEKLQIGNGKIRKGCLRLLAMLAPFRDCYMERNKHLHSSNQFGQSSS